VSFLVAIALGVAAFVAVPILAHLLRRGETREQEFPPAALVPRTATTARQRRHLEDRALLGVRGAIVVALAVLGATPLVTCDRLSLARDAGASVAIALVIDDSHSMRAELPEGGTRWGRALAGARDLLRSAREGDAVALVLAGRPARVALAATTDLTAARDALAELRPSDRPTDLGSAVQLARAALKPLPHVDKRLAVLSDLADARPPEGEPPAWTPLAELAHPVSDCAVLRAQRARQSVVATIACTARGAAEGRQVELVDAASESEAASAKVAVATALGAREGEQTVTLESAPKSNESLWVRLPGKDATPENDRAPVLRQPAELVVGTVVDSATASALTGGPTLLEQALAALSPSPSIRPMSIIPDDDLEIQNLAALVIDDPPGLSPEARATLGDYLEAGGVAIAFLGKRSETAQLASTLEPFARGAVRWENAVGLGVEPASLAWLGPEGASLDDLTRTGRARLDGAEIEGAEERGRWKDGRSFLLERRVGRGVVATVGLPVSVEASDLALRPAFLALLDHTLTMARERSSPAATLAGVPWLFEGVRRVTIDGPDGAVDVGTVGEAGSLRAVPTMRGRYTVHIDGATEVRVATLEASEILTPPAEASSSPSVARGTGVAGQVDISREVALLVLGLFTLELLLRYLGRRLPLRRAEQADAS
jgi:hypothetical protein